MPTYTYRCEKGHEFDEFRSVSEDSQTSAEPCPTCVEAACRGAHDGDINKALILAERGRKIVPTGVTAVFKGRGWTPKFYRNRTGK